MNDQLERFLHDDMTLGVLGLGYVGLPLSMEAGRAEGVTVLGFDVDAGVVERLNAGDSHVPDVPSEQLREAREGCRFEATTEMSRLAECDVISICVPTPLSKTRDPDVSFIMAATESVADAFHPGQLVVLESTTYPGTTREVMLPALQANGMEPGEDFFLCFSPERVDPGNREWRTRNTPKVIGGITPACTQVGAAFYGRFIQEMVPVSSAEAAELTKLLENTFRAVNIGLVNEVAQIADRLAVNVWEVIDAAATKPFGFMKFTPGPGLGGHCIPVDPHYLSWKMKTLNYRARFIDLASEINSEMPFFVVDKVRDALNDHRKPVRGSRVLVLGVAYKPDVDDIRESPALDVIRLLEEDGAEVVYHDPHVPELRIDDRVLTSREMDDDLLQGMDAAVIVTNHSAFDLEQIFTHSEILVDARNATAGIADRARTARPQRWIVKG